MNRIFRSILLISFSVIVILSGCTKSSDNNPTNNPTNSSSAPTPSFGDASGTFAAVTSVSYQTVAGITIPLTVNTAVGALFTSAGSGSYVDGGNVALNSKTLSKQSNNSYVYQNLTDPLTLGSTNSWNVSGSSSVPAFSYTYNRSMPGYSDYNSLPSMVTRSAGLTISLGSTISNADSVYVVVSGGNNKYVLQRVAGNAGQCSFSADELSVLSATSTGLLQVVPWNYKSEDFSDKLYYFVNETAYTKTVTVN